MMTPSQILRTSLLLTWVLALQTINAQSSTSTYEGTWKAEFSGDVRAYIILKDKGAASYFSNLDKTSQVHNASWSLNTTTSEVTIQSLHGDRFTISRGINAFMVNWDRPSEVTLSGTLVLVPPSEVGKWTLPPDEARRRFTTLTEAEGFFGNWEITDADGSPFFKLVIEDNRNAAASYFGSFKSSKGLRGLWQKRGDELHITWDSGHYSIIREFPDRYESVFFQPDEDLNSDSSGVTGLARRIDRTASGPWLTRYEQTKSDYSTSVGVFRKRSNARGFFRGKWDVRSPDGSNKETIDFGMFQDIDSDREGGMDGSWRVRGDLAYITWEDSLRAVVRPVDNRFVISIFKPEQALDGTPYKLFPLIPHDLEKLDKYVELRGEATERLRDYLETERRRAIERREDGDGWFNFWPFN